MLPSVTAFGMALGFVISGALVTEVVFAYPGLGYSLLTAVRQLEPPGFMGLNYGHRTPAMTLLGQAVYGAVLGGLPQLQELLQRG